MPHVFICTQGKVGCKLQRPLKQRRMGSLNSKTREGICIDLPPFDVLCIPGALFCPLVLGLKVHTCTLLANSIDPSRSEQQDFDVYIKQLKYLLCAFYPAA